MTLVLHGEPVRYLTFAGLTAAGLPHAVTTRHCPGIAGRSEIAPPFGPEARAALAPARLDLGRAAWARQVHGADVARAGRDGGYAGTGDILLTTEAGVPLAIFTADCLAVVLWDGEARALAVAHVGWRGAARGALEAAVAAACEAGARPARLRAAVAPAIGPCCYEVDAPVLAAFSASYPALVERWFAPGRPGHWMLDLWGAAEDLLARAGVPPDRVESARLCTACHPDLLHSYRRGNRGRIATVAALP